MTQGAKRSARIKMCPRCGTSYDVTAVFCQNDGAKLELASIPTAREFSAAGQIWGTTPPPSATASAAGISASTPASKLVDNPNASLEGAVDSFQRDDSLASSMAGREAADDSDPLIGTEVLGQFRIDAKVGEGGMGSVYRATQYGLERNVAIKVLHPNLASNADVLRRFQREAKIATRLDHPNLVRVLLFGQLPDKSFYIVMEYLEGENLADLLEREGKLQVARATQISLQITRGLAEVHALGVVHRDIKPENVMLVTRGGDRDFVKLLDFGIARTSQSQLSEASGNVQQTQKGLVFGTARYISPEGATGSVTDARSDIYSLGVVVYQMLAGRTPFDESSIVGLLAKHVHEAPPSLRRVAPHVPSSIADVVMQCLEKRPELRPESAQELAILLEDAAEREGLGSRSSSGTFRPLNTKAAQASSSVRRADTKASQRPTKSEANPLVSDDFEFPLAKKKKGSSLWIVLALAFLALGSGGFFWWQARQARKAADEQIRAFVRAGDEALARSQYREAVEAWKGLGAGSLLEDQDAKTARASLQERIDGALIAKFQDCEGRDDLICMREVDAFVQSIGDPTNAHPAWAALIPARAAYVDLPEIRFEPLPMQNEPTEIRFAPHPFRSGVGVTYSFFVQRNDGRYGLTLLPQRGSDGVFRSNLRFEAAGTYRFEVRDADTRILKQLDVVVSGSVEERRRHESNGDGIVTTTFAMGSTTTQTSPAIRAGNNAAVQAGSATTAQTTTTSNSPATRPSANGSESSQTQAIAPLRPTPPTPSEELPPPSNVQPSRPQPPQPAPPAEEPDEMPTPWTG